MPQTIVCCLTAPLLAMAWLACTAAGSLPDHELVRHTNETLAAWWLKPEEKRFDEIGWIDGLLAARRLSAQSGRPLFLFTMDGRVNTGRC